MGEFILKQLVGFLFAFFFKHFAREEGVEGFAEQAGAFGARFLFGYLLRVISAMASAAMSYRMARGARFARLARFAETSSICASASMRSIDPSRQILARDVRARAFSALRTPIVRAASPGLVSCSAPVVLPGLSARIAAASIIRPLARNMSTKQRVINTRKRKLKKLSKKPLSSNKSVRQRFRITANGHVKYKRAGLKHFLRNKSGAKKRRLRRGGIFTGGGRRAKQWHKLAKRVAYAYRKKH